MVSFSGRLQTAKGRRYVLHPTMRVSKYGKESESCTNVKVIWSYQEEKIWDILQNISCRYNDPNINSPFTKYCQVFDQKERIIFPWNDNILLRIKFKVTIENSIVSRKLFCLYSCGKTIHPQLKNILWSRWVIIAAFDKNVDLKNFS